MLHAAGWEGVMIRVKRAEKYGYCSGVRVADLKVRRFAAGGGKGAILGQVVHNERVVAEMEELGMRTVAAIAEAQTPTIVFSAHGVPPSYHERARRRGLEILDTTCKFVYDIHNESRAALDSGCHLVFIGEPDHREVVGYTHDLEDSSYHVIRSLADAENVDWTRYPEVRIFYQTTLNAEDYEEVVRFIERSVVRAQRADTICYATKENQDAARSLASDPEVELVLVIGGKKSANTRHLWEITSRIKPSHLIQGPEDIDRRWLEGLSCVGITAGASTPDALVDEVEAFVVGWSERAAAR
jgi:4-hydroxy-3-methylbut-2-enyl diphosphate reductase